MRLIVFLILFSSQSYAQRIYLISFDHKDSSYSINNPEQFLSKKAIQRRAKYAIPITETDLPVNARYLEYFALHGFAILSTSKWLNNIAVVLPTKEYIDTVKALSFVRDVTYLGNYRPAKTTKSKPVDLNEMLTVLDARVETKKNKSIDSNFYGKTHRQVSMLNTHLLHQQGFYGNGINIAVIDAGFNNTNQLPVFKQLLDSNRIKLTADFVQHESTVYEDDDHGTAVLSCLAGFMPNEFVGTAPFANYYLLRSEYAMTEMPIEQHYWIEAVEFADSIGIDLVTTSLGYTEFDDVSFNYTHKDLNGSTAYISQAAKMAVQKGMVVVVSAGNEGDNDWRFVSVPADVEEVITVGGVDKDEIYAPFSSIGPTADKRIKPDVMAQGDHVWVASSRGVFYQGDGTSYACPIMAGSVACLLQAHPNKLPKEFISALKLSGNHYFKPDNYVGFGIPDMQLANLILSSDTNEQVLDAQFLADKKIHVLLRTKYAQKAMVSVKNVLGKIMYTESISLKMTGVSRFGLSKTKKLKSGMYSLQFTSKTFSQTIPIQLP